MMKLKENSAAGSLAKVLQSFHSTVQTLPTCKDSDSVGEANTIQTTLFNHKAMDLCLLIGNKLEEFDKAARAIGGDEATQLFAFRMRSHVRRSVVLFVAGSGSAAI